VALLVNQARNANHWIGFRLVGTRSNRDAIGARVQAWAGKRTFVDEVRSGSSYLSNSDLRIHFGLGAASAVDAVEIRWPNGVRERFEHLAADKIHVLKEGTGKPAALPATTR
jgi:hypothetical protein